MKKGKIIEEKEIFNKEKNLLDSDKSFKKPINKIKLKRKKMKENDQNNDATLLRRIWNLFTFTSSRCINKIKKKCAKIDIEAPQASNLPHNSVKLNLAGLHLNLILNKEDLKLFYKSKSIDSYIALLNQFFF